MKTNAFKLLLPPHVELCEIDPEDSTLSEALQTIYANSTRDLLQMHWNGHILKLGLNAEIADIIGDIIKMMQGLQKREAFTIYWGSSSFFATWKFSVDGEALTVHSDWTSIRGPKENLEELRKVSNTVTVRRGDFTQEWMPLLRMIKDDLTRAGYTEEGIKDLGLLNQCAVSVWQD